MRLAILHAQKPLSEGSTVVPGQLTPTPSSDKTVPVAPESPIPQPAQPPSTSQSSPTMTWAPQPASPSSPTFPNTQAASGTPNGNGTRMQQMIDMANTLDSIRADHLANMPLDKKLELVLQKTTESEKIAYQALRGVSEFSHKLDRVFKDLSGMIERVAKGQPAREPDPPGSSIWDNDEGDPESIFGR